MEKQAKFNLIPIILIVLVVALDVYIWLLISGSSDVKSAKAYFLDVGQGDSELIILQSGVRILVDAGPDSLVSRRLDSILGLNDRYIDIGVITHPQTDHFGGYVDLMSRYGFGAIVTNGEDSKSIAWRGLIKSINDKDVKIVPLKSGDKVSAVDGSFEVLSPGLSIKSKNVNEKALIGIMYTPQFSIFLSSDMDSVLEKQLISSDIPLGADILKVAHHGSKYSSSKDFLESVNPYIGIVEVGAGNRYGHPNQQALDRIMDNGAAIFRTDIDGTLKAERMGDSIDVSAL